MRSLSISDFKAPLEACGYRGPLLVEDYLLGVSADVTTVPLVGFAHEPMDAGSACIAVITSPRDPSETIGRYINLGAPVFFAIHQGRVQWWAQGTEKPRHLATLDRRELRSFFERQRLKLAPESLYRAKTRGRFEAGYQLDFVDVGLMPLVEAEMGRKLGELVEQAVLEVHRLLVPRPEAIPSWLLQAVFWLLAAKILRDKQVPSFEDLDLTATDQAFVRVAGHYGAEDRRFSVLTQEHHGALAAAGEMIARFSRLAHVTPEALAAVYENALVEKETRRELGIHSTPSFLARYVVWRLAAWIEEIPVADRHVFEPTCGQGSFLVAAMRVLRDLLPIKTGKTERKAYLREHLHGLDIDPFAVELARLSLTLADVPNPDGWDLHRADLFATSDLGLSMHGATILLGNPPFENFSPTERQHFAERGMDVQPGSKALEVLRRTLPHLRSGGVFGLVVPQGFLHGPGAVDLRHLLVEKFEIAEISLLPDKIFSFSDAESALLIGRRLGRSRTLDSGIRYLRVREPDVDRFRTAYLASSERMLPQARFASAPDFSFAVPDLEEVWEECRDLASLGDLATVGQGLQFKGDLPEGTKTLTKQPFPNAQPGYVHFGHRRQTHELPEEMWMNLDPSVIGRLRSGAPPGKGQVLLNYAPVSRGAWRLKALIDSNGHAVSSRFLTVRPRREEISLLYLWALLNSPVANAFAYTHGTKRDNQKGTLAMLPVPNASLSEVRRVSNAADAYLRVARQVSEAPLFELPSVSSLRDLLLAVDAEVLRLYDLPPRLERQVLDLFAGCKRPGVPFELEGYFPADFAPYVPLHLYLSEDFKRSTAGVLRRTKSPVPDVVVRALRTAVTAFSE